MFYSVHINIVDVHVHYYLYYVNPPPNTHTQTDGTACIWDTDSAHMLLRYTGHTGSVNSVTFHPRESLVASGSGDNTVHIWNTSVSTPHRMEKNVSVKKGGGGYELNINFGEMGLFDSYIFSVAVALRYTRTASTLGNRFEPAGNSTEATRMSVRGYSNSFCSSTKGYVNSCGT